ncbi:MAG: phosphoribosyl-AMP cyclohydrolase [Candidatus Puniceispirillales bacterium]|jgi:phosphoribosyl-AMP cyclohydrolase|nr:phosphoribosyl-AMP cyclohydrolase [Alphaproteobacteria bacterium]
MTIKNFISTTNLTFNINDVKFNKDGLIPVISQCHNSGEVLMMAWMNFDSINKTIETQNMYYFSRSRNSLWMKGETSGNFQKLYELRLDCDGDTLLALIEQKGVACHTGAKSCFFKKYDDPQNG